MYNIYNNAKKLGGHLNIIFDRSIIINNESVHSTESIRFKTPKYIQRRKMTDITTRIGIVVMRKIIIFIVKQT